MKQPRTSKGYINVMAASFAVATIAIVSPYAVAKLHSKGAPLQPRTVQLGALASLVLLAISYRLIPSMEHYPTLAEDLEQLVERFRSPQSERITEIESVDRNQRGHREVSEGNASPDPNPTGTSEG